MALRVLVDEQHWVFRRREFLHQPVQHCLELHRIRWFERGIQWFLGHGDAQVGNIGRQLQVHRPLFPQAGTQRAINFGNRIHGADALGQCGEWAQRIEHVAEVAVGKRMVQQPALFRGKQWGSTGDRDHRDVLAGGPGQAVECGELANTVGGHKARDPAGARIAVGSIRGVELIGAAHKADAVGSFNLLQPVQVEITRHTNNFSDADFLQAADEKIANRHAHVVLALL